MTTLRISTMLLTVFILFVTACSSKPEFSSTYKFNSGKWSSGEFPSFTFTVADTNKLYDLSFLLRIDGDYEYQNIWLLMHNSFPDGTTQIDTLNLPIANERGEWLGKKKGNLFVYHILFGQKYRFEQLGKHEIRFEHAVMNPVLIGISDLTLIVESNK